MNPTDRIALILRAHFTLRTGREPAPLFLAELAQWLVDHGVTVAADVPLKRRLHG